MTSRANQGGFSDWQELRDHLIERYGSTPHPATEQDIIDAFELHPAAVEKAALDLIGAIGVTSPWGVLKSRAAKISTAPSNPIRSSSLDREKTIMRAEQWIRAAGIHYDRDTEILLELFDTGLLSAYAHTELIKDGLTADGKPLWTLAPITGDTALVERIRNAYHDARPAGIQLETEALERAETWKDYQAQLAIITAQVLAELDAKQLAPKDHPPGDHPL